MKSSFVEFFWWLRETRAGNVTFWVMMFLVIYFLEKP